MLFLGCPICPDTYLSGAHFSLCVHTFFRCSLGVRFSVRPLILPLCRLLLPTLYYRRQQPDHSGKLLIVRIGYLNLYTHICAPFMFVCFGKSFVVRSQRYHMSPFLPPDQMLPHPHRKEEITIHAPVVLVAHQSAVLISFVVPLPPGSGVGAPFRESSRFVIILLYHQLNVQDNSQSLKEPV